MVSTDLPFAFPIRVPDNLLVEMGKFTGLHWNDSFGMEPYVCEALRNYMKPAPPPQEQVASPSESGYQWKEVFLPEGTRLRASFDHQQYFAVVAGAEIKYGEHAISPSCFANLFGSGNRNAWKAVWLRLPGSTEWLLADVCRSARKAAIARLMEGDGAGTAGDERKQPANQPVKQSAPQRAKPSATAPAKQPPRPAGGSGITDGPFVRAAAPHTGRQGGPRRSDTGSPVAPGAGPGDSARHKKSAGRSARRKRRAMKQSPQALDER
ncbi:hypothetical protein [Duganella aceris]|uniref:Uncharacterized protein n=1 Tax=Duganella aceris TaxID=2703883 RepID=A0ABX0FPU9_9BURK|nr:hypothetical protein [Duganella aceris]NGZ86475.1 hypothetical protein [Duganella aceris]